MRLVDYFIETSCGPEVHDQLNKLEASWNQACVVDAYHEAARLDRQRLAGAGLPQRRAR